MIIRTALPVDLGLLQDMDYNPCYVWVELREGIVTKVMEMSQPVGFMTYFFCQKAVMLEKLVVRDDLLRTGLGTEAMHWLINRARRKDLDAVQMILTEEQALSEDCYRCHFLNSCGFKAVNRGGKIVFTRHIVS